MDEVRITLRRNIIVDGIRTGNDDRYAFAARAIDGEITLDHSGELTVRATRAHSADGHSSVELGTLTRELREFDLSSWDANRDAYWGPDNREPARLRIPRANVDAITDL